MNKIIIEIIGYAAGILLSITMVPQLLLSIKSKDVSGLSLGMVVLFFISMVLWTIYGFSINSMPLMITNSVATIVSGIQLYIKVRHRSGFGKKDIEQ